MLKKSNIHNDYNNNVAEKNKQKKRAKNKLTAILESPELQIVLAVLLCTLPSSKATYTHLSFFGIIFHKLEEILRNINLGSIDL